MKDRINEVLEKRDVLGEMAVMLYGEFYIAEKSFWESSVQRDLYKVEEELMDMGWNDENLSPEMEMASLLIFEALMNDGIIPNKDWEDEEDEEI